MSSFLRQAELVVGDQKERANKQFRNPNPKNVAVCIYDLL